MCCTEKSVYKGANSLDSQVTSAILREQSCYKPEEDPVSALTSRKPPEAHLWNWVLIPNSSKASEGIL